MGLWRLLMSQMMRLNLMGSDKLSPGQNQLRKGIQFYPIDWEEEGICICINEWHEHPNEKKIWDSNQIPKSQKTKASINCNKVKQIIVIENVRLKPDTKSCETITNAANVGNRPVLNELGSTATKWNNWLFRPGDEGKWEKLGKNMATSEDLSDLKSRRIYFE